MTGSAAPQICVLGGTSEGTVVCECLAAHGFSVHLLTATHEYLSTDTDVRIMRHAGAMDANAFADFILAHDVLAVVDATHPYAQVVKRHAREAAQRTQKPYVRYARPAGLETTASAPPHVLQASSHSEAAQKACALGKPVLLTTGSRNLQPYVAEARQRGVPLFARVLPGAEGQDACATAGIPAAHVIAARGPFSVAENLAHICAHQIGVMVSKESGAAGGLPEKIEATKEAGIPLVLVGRPPESAQATAPIVQSSTELLNVIASFLS